MERHGARRLIRKVLFSWPMVILLSIMVFVLFRAASSVYDKSQLAKDRRNAALAELANLESREKDLESVVQSLNTDRGLEEEIRKRFRVAKPGEEAIILIEEPKATTVLPASKGR